MSKKDTRGLKLAATANALHRAGQPYAEPATGGKERRPYRWRDPARVSPARLAELAEHDAHIAAMEAAGEMSHRALGTPSRQAQVAAREAEFARLREAGLSTQEAGRAVGIKETGARRYERRRVAAKGRRDVLEAEVRDHEAEARAVALEAALVRAHVEADAGPGG